VIIDEKRSVVGDNQDTGWPHEEEETDYVYVDLYRIKRKITIFR